MKKNIILNGETPKVEQDFQIINETNLQDESAL